MKGIRLISSKADFNNVSANSQLLSLQYLDVNVLPKMVYSLNENFSLDGIELKAVYQSEDGYSEIIDVNIDECDVIIPELSYVGSHDVKITYNNCETIIKPRVIDSNVIDCTNEFIFTDKSTITASNGNMTSGSKFMKSSDYVNCAGASSITLSFIKWTSSAGTASGYGMAFYNSSKKFISSEACPVADSSLGNSAGSMYEITIEVPTNTQYIRTTYTMDESKYGAFYAKLNFN